MKVRSPDSFIPMKQWPNFRDLALFFGGLAGVAHETLIATTERPTLLILFAAMLGLPAFLRNDANNDGPAPVQPPQPPEALGPANDK